MLAVAATTPALAGGPEITRLDITFPVDEVDPADCFEGTMHVTGSERVVGQIVDFGDNPKGHGRARGRRSGLSGRAISETGRGGLQPHSPGASTRRRS